MNRLISLKAGLVLALLAFMLTANVVQAGVFSDIKLWFSEKANIYQHSRSISSEVKTLYRERKSIQSFAEGASALVKAYKSISNKTSKVNFPKLLDIAHAITKVVSGYQNLAPKAEAMYKRAKPSMSYFADLADKTTTIQTAKNRIAVKGFSEERLNSLAGANGWGRVFGAIKENPLNLFKWGRLSDEYKMGKVEAAYPLKCAQIAFDATAYYAAAKSSVQELLGIKSEIDGILGGNLDSLLNMGSTINKINSVGPSVEALGDIAEKGANAMTKRFDELLKVQDEYVAASRAYNEKYNPQGNTTNSGSYSASAPQTSRTVTTGGINGTTGNSKISLDKAMQAYQKAYQAYVEISHRGDSSQAEVDKAIADLQKAKKLVDQAKAQAR
ncbi:MAG: hypothetical protein ACOYXC_06855 [Candidatus Rifleibacteriota bacterium]